ncbi:hypothetical protein OG440_13735 [Streptomyces sp. NBC_00637]|uniref:hypothetical protein n=1 Tax=Streptomyces sp. NBC_00637 TaxID=2903667 RepID=UPI00324342E6
MGERLNDGAGHSRRRAHPADAADDGPEAAAATLEALLGRALRDRSEHGVRGFGEGERRAVAAFRAARDAGAHQARTRRRDDWRPRVRRHTARSLRATLSVLVAGLTLGGVAFAAVATSTDGAAEGAGHPEPPVTASGARSDATVPVSPRPAASADRDRPVNADDTAAHCRAYEKVGGRGQAMDSTAWRRLATAAGGEKNVLAYCAAQAAASAGAAASASAGDGPKPAKTPKAAGTRKAAGTPEAAGTPKIAKTPAAGRTPEAGKSAEAAESGAKGR